MIPKRIENIDIESKGLISILHGKVDDWFITADTIRYSFDEILYLYLKSKNYDAVVFYDNQDKFYSYGERDLEVLLTDPERIEPTRGNTRKRRGPLGFVDRTEVSTNTQTSLNREFIRIEKNYRVAFRTEMERILALFRNVFENSKFKIAIIVNQAMYANMNGNEGGADNSFFAGRDFPSLLVNGITNYELFEQKHKIICNYATQETFLERDFPQEILGQLYDKIENGNIVFKPRYQIKIGLPQKDEIENLLHYLRFEKNKTIEYTDCDEVINSIEMEELGVTQIIEKVCNIHTINKSELINAGVIKNNKIEINLNQLESDMKGSIKGQDDIINVIIEKLKGWTRKTIEKPLSFFSVGTSGVGKTLTAEKISVALSSSGFGYLELRMNEYNNEADAWRLIGSPTGYTGSTTTPILFQRIRENRRLIICFDEIEKAHSSILTLLMQLIDKGKLSNNNYEGDFKECILFFTSNLAKTKVLKYKEDCLTANNNNFLSADFQKKIKEILGRESRQIPSEVWGRIDAYLVYNSLSYKEVIEISINYIRQICKVSDLDIDYIDPNYLAKLAKEHSKSEYGVRDLKKRIETEIFNII